MIELIVRAALAGIVGLIILINGDPDKPHQQPSAPVPPPYQQHDK